MNSKIQQSNRLSTWRKIKNYRNLLSSYGPHLKQTSLFSFFINFYNRISLELLADNFFSFLFLIIFFPSRDLVKPVKSNIYFKTIRIYN